MKRWPWLTSFYSRNLQKSGLSYGIPSKKKMAKLYSRLILVQEEELRGTQSVDPFNVAVIVNQKADLLDFTLRQLSKIEAIETVFLIVDEIDEYGTYTANNDQGYELIVKSAVDFSTNQDCEINNLLIINAGDSLHPYVQGALTKFIKSNHMIGYFDSDLIDLSGQRKSPKLHRDWDPDLLLSSGYINTGMWLRTNRVLSDKSCLSTKNTSIADFLVDAYLSDNRIDIGHIPLVVVHSLNKSENSKLPLSREVIDKISVYADVTEHPKFPVLKLLWRTEKQPLVSLIIPTKNAKELVKACIESILNKTVYNHYEILLVDNQSDDKESLEYFNELAKHPKIKVLKYDKKFNYSAINNFAVGHASGEIIGLINNDVEVIEPNWLSYMVGQVTRLEVGCVGAKLLYSDGRIQHAGVVMGYGGGAGHAHKYFPRDHSGYLNRLAATNSFSAVTAACLLVKKADYEAVGGLDEENLEVAFNDVDFCLKILGLNRRNVYCSEAELFHHESISRGFDDTQEKMLRFNSELAYLQNKWPEFIQNDPAYNPYLTLRRENFSIKEFG
ncbi:glycosyl transferase family protein [Aliiglaciecola lipolytica E3]|uniref:Glycosyl transferase family protein n=2 Tax=Aliiglaciecola TaxID=1406885 RepID=K6Y9N4_9ALTE|nr:glycosyl transferase family protein [Aliiglaciecola lipolytica E3]